MINLLTTTNSLYLMPHVIGLLLAVHPASALNKNNNFEVVVLLFMLVRTSIKIQFHPHLFPQDLY